MLFIFYHVEKCGKNDCGTYKFICDLRYLYIVDVLNEVPGVENLQKYCRNNYDFFYVIITFLNTRSEIKKEKIKLEIKQK